MTLRGIILAAVFIALSGAPAASQVLCGLRDKMTAQIESEYGETLRGFGLAGPQAIFAVYASDRPPYTWTILKITPNGAACVMAVGAAWDDSGSQAPGWKL